MGKIANAGGHHPNNTASDYEVRDWYYGNWNAVLRPTNQEVAELSANMAIAAANNNNIIYIFGGSTYHQQLALVGYDPAAIQVQCGTDCMGTCFANIKGAMARLGMDNSMLPNLGTYNADALLKAGYQKFTDSDHVRTDAHAMRGDVYVQYSVHACMHVGDGVLNGYSTGTSTPGYGGQTGGTATNLNIEAMSPYILRIPESDTSFDGDRFRESQVCGVALSAGYLYAAKTHVKQESYIAKNLNTQVECANRYGMPFALIAEVRARSVAEAKEECDKLYYVCAAHIPTMSLWLHLDLGSSKETNNRILEYYYETCSTWGFKNTLGVYVTKDELERVSWEDYSDLMYLWGVDHSLDVSKYVGVLPFNGVGSGGWGTGTKGDAQDLGGWDFEDWNYVDQMRQYAQLHDSNSGWFITSDGNPPCRTVVFKKNGSTWTAVAGWYCGVGRKTTKGGSRTVPGVRELRNKWPQSDVGPGAAIDFVEHYPYTGGVPVAWGNDSQSFHAGMQLGTWGYTTHGCISLTTERAIWLYNNIPTTNVEGVSSRCIMINTTGFSPDAGLVESQIYPPELHSIEIRNPFA